MHRFHFSLLALFGFVAVVAVGCAALARPSQLWLVVVSGLTLAGLFYAILAAVYGRDASRAFWVGFTLVAWGYVALEWASAMGLPFCLPTGLVTGQLQSAIHKPPTTAATAASVAWPYPLGDVRGTVTAEAIPKLVENAGTVMPTDPQIVLSPADGTPPNEYAVSVNSFAVWSAAGPLPANDVDLEAFGQIARWLWLPLLGFAGGLVALGLYHRRERQDGQKAPAGQAPRPH